MAGEKRISREEASRRTLERLKKFSEQLDSGEPVSGVYSCRKIVLEDELQPYSPQMVKELRLTFKVSQALFARFLNVSVSLLQKWEQGAKHPDGAALRLIDEIRQEPEHFRKRFRSMVRTVEPSDGRKRAA